MDIYLGTARRGFFQTIHRYRYGRGGCSAASIADRVGKGIGDRLPGSEILQGDGCTRIVRDASVASDGNGCSLYADKIVRQDRQRVAIEIDVIAENAQCADGEQGVFVRGEGIIRSQRRLVVRLFGEAEQNRLAVGVVAGRPDLTGIRHHQTDHAIAASAHVRQIRAGVAKRCVKGSVRLNSGKRKAIEQAAIVVEVSIAIGVATAVNPKTADDIVSISVFGNAGG